MGAKVYFTNMRTKNGESLLIKLDKLIKKAKMDEIDFKDKFVAIKIHFGEAGNLAFLRSNFAKVVVDMVKQLGGKPFLTDCNTLYIGSRKNALEHMQTAYENGYSPLQTGCHVIIADGLKGTDEALITVEGAEHVKEAKIGRAIADADIIISLSHFKGHELTGFGGTLKNIGMGSGSRAGKMEMHNAGKPIVEQSKCIGCHSCKKICAHSAITIESKIASIDENKCSGCGRCLGVCPTDAVVPNGSETMTILNKKIAEYSKAVLNGKQHFHISAAMDISPYCDCHPENDLAIIPDVGLFASFDPIAIDVACADKCNQMPVIPGSRLDDNNKSGICDKLDTEDHFTHNHPETKWLSCVEHGEKLGIGTTKYEIIEI